MRYYKGLRGKNKGFQSLIRVEYPCNPPSLDVYEKYAKKCIINRPTEESWAVKITICALQGKYFIIFRLANK